MTNQRKTILLADDDDSLRTFIKRSLCNHGYTVNDFEDGAQALKEFKTNSFSYDLIVSDIVMPEMDGITFTHQARKINPEIKIIYITGFTGMAEGNNLETNSPVISKPFHLKDIISQINDLLSDK